MIDKNSKKKKNIRFKSTKPSSLKKGDSLTQVMLRNVQDIKLGFQSRTLIGQRPQDIKNAIEFLKNPYRLEKHNSTISSSSYTR